MPVGDLVESAEQPVQGMGELIRRRASGLLGRSDRVDEDHRHLLERLRDPPAGRDLELIDDDLRQDVQEQTVGSLALLVELTLPQEQRSRKPLHPMRSQAAQEPEQDEVERRQHPAHGATYRVVKAYGRYAPMPISVISRTRTNRSRNSV